MDVNVILTVNRYLKELMRNVRIDRYKYVCAAFGIDGGKAGEMWSFLQTLSDGGIPFFEGRPVPEETLNRAIQLADEARNEYEESLHLRANLHNFGYCRWGEDFSHALFILEKEEKVRVEELNISEAQTYIAVSLLVKGGWRLKKVIRQCDSTSHTSGYLNFTTEERNTEKKLRIYDGDVFEVVPSGKYSDRPKDFGMYLCHNGAYRKLLYIQGRGYVKNGEPLIDDELEIAIDENGLFNSYKFTWGNFRKVGNINVDIGCLIEKKN